ncbi:MAG: hypothetical protein IJ153_05600 [Clostridia bacterium]|nr:hypothetical protein [Clostridia bacterium]MBQ9211159.1 hypothetical protein [Clostridia bacterium]
MKAKYYIFLAHTKDWKHRREWNILSDDAKKAERQLRRLLRRLYPGRVYVIEHKDVFVY